MIIKFSCSNHCLDFQKTEEELCQERPITHCPWCGEKLHIENISEVVNADIKKRVKEGTDKGLRECGIEGFIELIERQPDGKVKKLYIEELKQRRILND